MASIHELYGQQAEALQTAVEAHAAELAEHLKTFALLRRLKAGAVKLDDLTIGGSDAKPTWTITPAGPRPVEDKKAAS